MNIDAVCVKLLIHSRSLRTRIDVTDPDDGEVTLGDRAIHVRPGREGMVEILRLRHPSEGTGEVVLEAPLATAAAVGIAQLEEMDRLHRRAEAIAGQSYPIAQPPSWSLCADRAALGALRALGVDPREALNPPAARWVGGDPTAAIRHQRLADAVVVRRGARCHLRMQVLPEDWGGRPAWTYDDTQGRPRLCITSPTGTRPEILASAPGGPVGAIAAIPGVEPDTVVAAIGCEGRDDGLFLLAIELEPAPRPLAGAPDGVRTDWLLAA